MVRWDPFRELVSLREVMDRLFEDSFIRPSRALTRDGGVATIPIDMYQTENEVIVKASLPGVKPEDLVVSITGDVLTIKGELKGEAETKRENYIAQERWTGSFYRDIALPTAVKSDQAEASYEHGILTLRMPIAEEVKPKQINIKVRGALEPAGTR